MITLAATAQVGTDAGKPTLFLIGDSTVKTGRGTGENGQWGWGSFIGELFDKSRIDVANHALGGTSSRTFQTLGSWEKVLALVKPGDYVMMQFGHNDGGPLDDNRRARGTIPGIGDESREIDNPLTGKKEVVHTYGWYMRKYIADTKAKGATPIVLSMIPRNSWTADGKANRVSDTYGKWAAEAAAAGGAFFINLNEITAKQYEAIGREKVAAEYFTPADNTHTSEAGARLNAASVVQGLKELKDCALAGFLAATAKPTGAGERAGATDSGQKAAFLQWASKPPMGWNSWDCFATTVTEEQTKAQADYMAEHLRATAGSTSWWTSSGTSPKREGFNYRRGAELVMDEWGRLWPATNRFPSAANGVGFKALADYVHGKGLKFGIHLCAAFRARR